MLLRLIEPTAGRALRGEDFWRLDPAISGAAAADADRVSGPVCGAESADAGAGDSGGAVCHPRASGQRRDRRADCAGDVGRGRVGWSPRWSGIRMSCGRAAAEDQYCAGAGAAAGVPGAG